MTLFAKSMSIFHPPGGGSDCGLSFPHDFSGVQSKPAEGVQVSGTVPSISAAAAMAGIASPTAKIALCTNFMDSSPSLSTGSVVLLDAIRFIRGMNGFSERQGILSSPATYDGTAQADYDGRCTPSTTP